MSALRHQPSTDTTKALLFGGAAFLAAGTLWYLLRRSKSGPDASGALTEEQVYHILQATKREVFVLLRSLSRQSREVQEKIKDQFGSYPPQFAPELIHSLAGEDSVFQQHLKQLQLDILASHGVNSLEKFEKICEKWQARSPRIARLMAEAQSNFEKALEGRLSAAEIPFPPGLTKDSVIRFTELINWELLRRRLELAREFRQRLGPGFASDQAYKVAVIKTASNLGDKEFDFLFPINLIQEHKALILYEVGADHFRKNDPEFAARDMLFNKARAELLTQIQDPEADYDQLLFSIQGLRFVPGISETEDNFENSPRRENAPVKHLPVPPETNQLSDHEVEKSNATKTEEAENLFDQEATTPEPYLRPSGKDLADQLVDLMHGLESQGDLGRVGDENGPAS